MVLFQEDGAARDSVYVVRNLWHQALGLIDGLGRAYRYLPHEEEPAWVLADRSRAGQALVNLILNAAWVTPDGGEIRVRLRRRPGLVGLAVEDDGPGIPREIRDRVLDPFFTTKPEGEGTGLGLPVTRTIVDAHGGELAFEFPERGGTVVTVWLREAAGRDGRGTAGQAPAA